MTATRIHPLKSLWWDEPTPRKKPKEPSKRLRMTPVYDNGGNLLFKQKLSFNPSRRWVRYGALDSVERSYLTELYNVRSVQKRYGLTQMTARYWREHILPDPFEVSTGTNVKAFYWSRIQLVVLDQVLKWIEGQGILTIRKTDTDLLSLIDHGCDVLEDHYTERYDRDSVRGHGRKMGVRLLD